MLKLKQNHTSRDVKVLTDQLVDAVASAGGGSAASPYMATVLTSANAGAAQTALGLSDFAKTLLDDPDSPAALTTLGFTSTGVALATAASASTALTALGVSPFAKTLLDDTDAATARSTIGALAQTTWDNRKQYVPFNYIYNGNFYFWRINSGQTNDDFGSADRWYNGHFGSTKVVSRQVFTSGQTAVPGFDEAYLRTVVTSVAGAGNRVFSRQPMENARTLAGKTATVTFYAKADAARPIAIEFVQFFGNGTASAAVTGIGAQKFTLSTSWQKCQAVINIPSIAGKTLDANYQDSLDFNIWFEAGSNFNSRTVSLGQQSGTFDIAHVSIVEGDATDIADPFFPKGVGVELAELLRHYQFFQNVLISGYGAASANVFLDLTFVGHMRAVPNQFFFNTSYSNASAVASNTAPTTTHHRLQCRLTAAGSGWCQTGVEYYAVFYGY
ncbi:hypothetical protein [Rhizobium sp. 2MFCol3.1]|uniref:hypothetical protein n=1 Tax=Rhizobium sp. 2MFCol3.1 TaxID=1246459 RepID=UPI00035D5850|nr:hypothetical protein [Rhizobium sp. 2MFCol3.1]